MEKILEQINRIVKKMPCCDFEIVGYNGHNLLVGGGYSLSYEHSIVIEFEGVFFMTLNSEWSIDTTTDFLFFAENSECTEINQKYRIEQGYTLFKAVAEDLAIPFYISAKNIILKKAHTELITDLSQLKNLVD